MKLSFGFEFNKVYLEIHRQKFFFTKKEKETDPERSPTFSLIAREIETREH